MEVNKLGDRLGGHPLPCGRFVEDVFDDLEVGRTDEHARTCPHCATARRSLTTLMEATRALVDDPAEPSPNLLDRIMQAVRAEARRGPALPLVPTDDTGAVACRTWGRSTSPSRPSPLWCATPPTPSRGYGPAAAGLSPTPRTRMRLRIEMTVSLRYGTGPVQDLLDTVRARIGSALQGQVGVRAGAVDLHVVDLWPDGERRP